MYIFVYYLIVSPARNSKLINVLVKYNGVMKDSNCNEISHIPNCAFRTVFKKACTIQDGINSSHSFEDGHLLMTG